MKTLREGLAGNSLARIYGILNGTCNYILTRMEQAKLSHGDRLQLGGLQGQTLTFYQGDLLQSLLGYASYYSDAYLVDVAATSASYPGSPSALSERYEQDDGFAMSYSGP